MMAHVPMLAHGSVKDVLIVGGGDGGTLKEVLKHDIRRATLVELDKAVIEMTAQHMPSLSAGAFGDRRAQVVIENGARYLARCQTKFDVLIVDSTDRLGPGRSLYTVSFYRACMRCLKKNGLMVNQNGIPFLWPSYITLITRRRQAAFGNASLYLASVPSYSGGFQAFGWASKECDRHVVSRKILQRRVDALGLVTKYYSPEIHERAFALPPFIRKMLPPA